MSSAAHDTDGRVLRGERNREVIVEAILALIRRGETSPTAELVARQAGVGTRTVFRHFADMEDLYDAVNQRMAVEIQPLFEGAVFRGGPAQRAVELVRCRTKIFERIAPFLRRESSHESRSRVIRQGRAGLDARLRQQLGEAFGPELDRAEPDRIEALDALLSWESWNRMRTTQHLGRERTARLLEAAALVLLDSRESSRR